MGFKYEINFLESRPCHEETDLQPFKNCGCLLYQRLWISIFLPRFGGLRIKNIMKAFYHYTVEPAYNAIGLSDTSSIALRVMPTN